MVVAKGSKVKSYKDLKGKTVGAKNGTSSYSWLEDHAGEYGFTVRAYDEASTMYDSLNSGSIDALMDDEAVLLYAIQQGVTLQHQLKVLLLVKSAFAVKKVLILS